MGRHLFDLRINFLFDLQGFLFVFQLQSLLLLALSFLDHSCLGPFFVLEVFGENGVTRQYLHFLTHIK